MAKSVEKWKYFCKKKNLETVPGKKKIKAIPVGILGNLLFRLFPPRPRPPVDLRPFAALAERGAFAGADRRDVEGRLSSLPCGDDARDADGVLKRESPLLPSLQRYFGFFSK